MTRGLWVAALFLLLHVVNAEDDSPLTDLGGDNGEEPRFLVFTSNSTYSTSLTIAGAVVLIALTAYVLSIYGGTSLFGTRKDRYKNKYFNNARSSDTFSNLNILEWIAMAEEVYRKFDPNDINCQKRVICEMVQKKDHYGPSARALVGAFSYLKYFDMLDEFINLPGFFRELVDEYKDAMDVGLERSGDGCKDYYDTCRFSLSDTVDKYIVHNSVQE